MRINQTPIVEANVEETDDATMHFFEVDRRHADLPLSVLVCEAVEEVSGASTDEIEPLGHYIDVEALDGLFGDRWNGQPRSEGEVTFPMDDYVITVVADGRVIVTESA